MWIIDSARRVSRLASFKSSNKNEIIPSKKPSSTATRVHTVLGTRFTLNFCSFGFSLVVEEDDDCFEPVHFHLTYMCRRNWYQVHSKHTVVAGAQPTESSTLKNSVDTTLSIFFIFYYFFLFDRTAKTSEQSKKNKQPSLIHHKKRKKAVFRWCLFTFKHCPKQQIKPFQIILQRNQNGTVSGC